MDVIFDGLSLGSARKLLSDKLNAVMDGREANAVAQLVMEHVTRLDAVELALHLRQELSEYESRKLSEILSRLLKHEPIQYIIGEEDWGGLKIKVAPGVLIPRPETAQLVDIITDRWADRSDLRVLDVCTGSGCIAVALALRLKFSAVTAVDISDVALDVARENAARYKTRIDFKECDVLNGVCALSGTYNIIVSNPPYIAENEKSDMEQRVVEYEPSLALFVPDDDPLVFYRAIMNMAAESLDSHGVLYFEINPRFVDQLKDLAAKILPDREVSLERDLYGRERFMVIS
ncbi:MAG: peptide chain release factor N(5)-glutamine methyltransferase [Muribaculaceae bacterium]|nr:peptide chain release factor N(5)-glutamine methyltransferase [Muribaculaceae bacterium]